MTDEAPAPKKSAQERFFAIDARSWPKVCGLGMPAAVSYLVLACGTGGDQITTRWSVDAIERHTGIGRPRAKAAVQALVDAGLVRIEKGGTRPLYRMVHETERASTLTEEEERILGILTEYPNLGQFVPKVGRYDNIWKHGKPYETAQSLVQKGRLKYFTGQSFAVIADPAASPPDAPDWVWLPSSIVESDGGQRTPVEAIRQSQNVDALRLLIDLYHAQSLIYEPGVPWRKGEGLRTEYERVKIGEHREHVIWGFQQKSDRIWWSAPFASPLYDGTAKEDRGHRFWAALRILKALRLVVSVPHLVDSDSETGEVMFPVPVEDQGGEDCEKAVGRAAVAAAGAMLTDGQCEWALSNGITNAAPVLRHVEQVQAVGIFRLQHRPHTEATRAWLANLTADCKAIHARYEELYAPLSPSVQHQGGIKDASR
jgi:hypothetical protein